VNLQQVPRDEFVKGIFGAQPGWAFIECDYSQIELRLAAFHAREDTMLNLYRNGQDIHMTMAMRMTGKPMDRVTSEERKKAKAVNFGFLYGMGWSTFINTTWNSYGVVVTEAEAKAFRKAFFDEFPRLVEWHQRQRRLANKFGRVESPLGRVRHLPDIRSNDRSVKQTAERQAINSPIQSFASDMVVLALISLHREFRAKGLKARSVGTVHDAVNFEAPIEELDYVLPRIKYHMENLPLKEMFGINLDVPIIGDVCVGRRWGLKEDIPAEIVNSPASLDIWLSKHGYSTAA
jgi:DNA polymerase-1